MTLTAQQEFLILPRQLILSGVIPFNLAVQTNNQRVHHEFSVTINSVSDEPYFEDFNSDDNMTHKLPAGTVNQDYSYFFHLNDPDIVDIDDLNLTPSW